MMKPGYTFSCKDILSAGPADDAPGAHAVLLLCSTSISFVIKLCKKLHMIKDK
jgi:hypothetical protein